MTESKSQTVEPPKPPPATAGILSGAAFLMAVSAIGPGFLTQTTQFTAQLGASLACAILLSTVIDIGAQLNTWRVIGVSGKRGNEVADAVLPGLGAVLTLVIVAGSFLFNIGNLNGCALGLEALFGLNQSWGAVLSTLAVGLLFLSPSLLTGIDWMAKGLGVMMIALTLFIVVKTRPPLLDAIVQSVAPEKFDQQAVLTLIGGTIGGYIMFSGAHRLIDGGVTGPANASRIARASVQGIIIAGLMRAVLFLAVLGVVAGGATIGKDTPVFDAFSHGAGSAGYVVSGLVFWAAAITSVVGCSYTSVSFLPWSDTATRRAILVGAFTAAGLVVTLILQAVGVSATPVLIGAGKINGLMTPVVLGVILLAAHRRSVMGDFRQPLWATVFGCAALATTLYMAFRTIAGWVG